MSDDIFNLLMMILMLENGGGQTAINQMVLMFLIMQNRNGCHDNRSPCGGNDGYTF